MSRPIDVGTTSTSERIAAMQAFREEDYKVNVNFVPVIYCEGWHKFFTEINGSSDQETKKQLAT